MSTSIAGTEVRRYVEAVRAHLTDLSPEDRDELLEDLEEHLLEVAAEEDGTLEQRLGPPAIYAEELRASAGLSARGETGAGLVERLTQSQPVRTVAAALDSPQARALQRFMREVQPGWWVLRGYLGILVLGVIFARDSGFPVRETIPFPFLLGSYVWGFPVILLAIWVSVQLGRRATRDKRAWLVSLAATGVVLASGFTVLGDLRHGAYAYADEGSGYEVHEAQYLHHADGTEIANICPYSSDGKLLAGVLMFDQYGRAIVNTADSSTGFAIERVQPAILNAYPLSLKVLDHNLVTQPLTCPSSVAAQPQAAVTPASSPSITP